ncbi:expressed unknown protein [Ectocarpus siliculosus]|uniref:Uncharacterized protein n=1 Tax=Ectocarpus siliculosus TaxID=2880 RepID=D8LD93_ECTSI|nr:expressed unknown protein [Ectocarpus siliculosus]|eukprot:CBN80151.1 expressed unknown protein [Ectocarpus siliculosus]
MLTRKQQWRRVRGPRSSVETHQLADRGGRKTCPRAARVPDALAHPRAINSLSIDDSLLRLVATGRPAASDEEDEPAAAAAPAVPSSSVRRPVVDEIGAIRVGSNVRFNHQVRVVLVPSRKELRPLIEELWWGTNDYVEFRREFVQAMREAAAAEVENRANQETPSVPEIQDTVSNIFPTVGGPAEGQEDGGDCDGGLLRPAAPGVVLVATSIPPEALTLASAATTARKPPATAERRRKKSTAGGGRRGRKKEGTSLLPSPGSFSSSRDSWRLVAPAVQELRRAERVKRAADFNWAPIAGPSTAAAKAAAAAAAEAAAAQDEEEDGGYRTHSLSSASEEGCDDSDEESGHGCGKDEECRGAAKTMTRSPQQPGCGPDLFSRDERTVCMA